MWKWLLACCMCMQMNGIGIWDTQEQPDDDPIFMSSSIDPTKPMVALTFDDGPRPSVTNRILDTLAETNSHATFFILGSMAEKSPDTVKRIQAEGHQIGLHTYSHLFVNHDNIDAFNEEIEKCNQWLNTMFPKTDYVIRTPGGIFDDYLLEHMDYPVILWSIDTRDWKTQNAAQTVDHIMTHVKDGDIILMHDIYDSTADAVEEVVPQLIQAGYQLVTVEELMLYKQTPLEKHMVYRHG